MTSQAVQFLYMVKVMTSQKNLGPFHTGDSRLYDQIGRTTNWVKIQCDTAKIYVERPNVRRRPSEKDAIQINAKNIWFDFYCRIDLVTTTKRALGRYTN